MPGTKTRGDIIGTPFHHQSRCRRLRRLALTKTGDRSTPGTNRTDGHPLRTNGPKNPGRSLPQRKNVVPGALL